MKIARTMILGFLLGSAANASAGEIDIVGYGTDGGLHFQGATVSNYFTLEFAPTLDGPWTNWGSVSAAAITGTVMSLPSPFFYRIVATPDRAFPPYATGTPVYIEADAAALQTLADFELSAAALYQPLGDYATGTPVYVEADSAALAALAGYETEDHAATTFQPVGNYLTNGQPSPVSLGMVSITLGGRVGLGQTNPVAIFHVGDLVPASLQDYQISVARTVGNSAFGTNGHAFIDASVISRGGGVSYNSYDARVSIGGSAGTNDYSHYAAYQDIPEYLSSGSIGHIYGHYSGLRLANGTVSNRYGLYVDNANRTGGSLHNQYGVYVPQLSTGTSNNYAFYAEGTTPSRFGSIILGTNAPITNWPAAPADPVPLKAWSVWPDEQTNYFAISADHSDSITNDSFSAVMNHILSGPGANGVVIELANTTLANGAVVFYFVDAPIHIGGALCAHIRGNGGPHIAVADGYLGELIEVGTTNKMLGQTRISGVSIVGGNLGTYDTENTNAFLNFANAGDIEVADCYFSGLKGPAISIGTRLVGGQKNISIHDNWFYSSRFTRPFIQLSVPEGANAIWGANIANNYFDALSNAPCIDVESGPIRHVSVNGNIFNKYGYYHGTGIVVRSGYSHNISGNQFISFSTDSLPISFQPATSNDFRSIVANNLFGYSTPTNGIYLNANAHGVSVFGNSMPQTKIRFDGPNRGGYSRDFSAVPTNGGPVMASSVQLGTNAAISNWPAAPAAPAVSIVVDADYVVQAGDYAIGADTAAGDVAVILPDRGANFSSILIRKFSAANGLSIRRGSNVLESLADDGECRTYDWWPDRADWHRRNP